MFILCDFLPFTLYLFIPVHTEWEPGGYPCVHGQGDTLRGVVLETVH